MTSKYYPTFCDICGDKISVKEGSYNTICTNHGSYGGKPWGLSGVSEILANWKPYEKYLSEYQIYFYFELFNGYTFEFELSKAFSSAFYKFKACMCMTLNLHKSSKNADHIYLDFWGGADYWGEHWECGYELGKGVFSNWYITEL